MLNTQGRPTEPERRRNRRQHPPRFPAIAVSITKKA